MITDEVDRMAEAAVARKPSALYTERDITFIRRARSMLMDKYHVDDNTIATAIAGKKGWSEGSVDYQIGKMTKSGTRANIYNKSVLSIKAE